jgi:hypothetical protein
MIKVFRPFWSYDVEKTEEWLSFMAENGLYLGKLNRWTHIFFFRKGDPKKIIFQIGFDKVHGASLSKSLLDGGWIEILHIGNWYIFSNEKAHEQVTSSPTREGVIKHNRLIMHIFIGILIYLSGIAIFNIALLSLSNLQQVQSEVVESLMWIITYCLFGVAIVLFIITIYSIFKINKTNKYLLGNKPQSRKHKEGRHSKVTEKEMKRLGQLIVKRKLGWMYSPDKLEMWLEEMEKQGFNLYRVSRSGTVFYFVKGSPRKVSYCADYQNIADESYFDIHRDTGWKSIFVSFSSIQKWTIWCREYVEGEERPQIYSDKSHYLKHARRVAITYTTLFLPMVIIYFLNLGLVIAGRFNSNTPKLNIFNTVLYVFCLFAFGSFTVRTWLYYFRLRRCKEFHE